MERRITSKKSDKDGDITHIYGNNWGPVTVQDAVFQIEHNLYQYLMLMRQDIVVMFMSSKLLGDISL